jgi:hypothetical protein
VLLLALLLLLRMEGGQGSTVRLSEREARAALAALARARGALQELSGRLDGTARRLDDAAQQQRQAEQQVLAPLRAWFA